MYFQNIFNPAYVVTTDTIEIYVYDKNNQMIVSTNFGGPKVTTTAGSLNYLPIVTSDL